MPCCAAHSPQMLITCCWTNRPTTSTGKAACGSTSSFPGIRAGCWWPPTTVSCWPVSRILELSALGLRSYGGNYAGYRTQRDAEQLAARAALEHAATERKRTRARMHKEHDDSLRRSAKTLRTVDSLNIASFERVKYKGAAKSVLVLEKQHSDQNYALNAAVNRARERVEEENAVMFTLPGSEIPEGKQVLVLEELVLPHVPVSPINWRMDGPMRVALRGPNG